ncbi:Mrp/NBP35 family ATP-binding protein [Desulfovibrio sp. OttesenSCG-928-F20]|nr:Mrp/NBP35 family ATP-binding protein [Desulfovibrio sp. OttesenSCG-928-M16]MDL2290575.1 Mrp/NBP35 family ATP-binding protein [Desulfovibrio sp. OttesenSCG-928-F20]
MTNDPFEQVPPQGEADPACASRSTCSSAGADGSGCASCSSRPGNPLAEQDAAITSTLGHIKHTLFVMSGKGGVGKSSVTVNIAAALALKGYKVGILDVDIHGPSVPNLLGLTELGLEMDANGEKLLPAEYMPNLHVISMDSLLQDKDTAIIWRGPKKAAAIRQFIADVAWGDLDFLVVDSPPGTGDEHMTLLKMIPQALSVMVTTPQEISLADVRKAINFLQHIKGRILGIVENMSGLACPHCGGHIDLFKKGGGKKMAESYGIPFLGAVALDPATVVAADTGRPVVLLEGESAAKRDFLAVGDAVIAACEQGRAVLLELPPEHDE